MGHDFAFVFFCFTKDVYKEGEYKYEINSIAYFDYMVNFCI